MGEDNASCHFSHTDLPNGPSQKWWLGPPSCIFQGKSMFLAFQHGVMYVLSFATIITVFATAIALAV
jgi:hypothetical protein